MNKYYLPFTILVIAIKVFYDLNNSVPIYSHLFLWVSCFIYIIYIHTGVQHDLHIVSCSFRLTVTRHVSLVEQELITLPRNLNSISISSGFVLFNLWPSVQCSIDYCLSFCPFSFGNSIVCPYSIFDIWIPLLYLQTFLIVPNVVMWRYFNFSYCT